MILGVGALSLWLQTDAARQMLFQKGVKLLQEKLQTKVTADSISVELMKGQVRVYNMQINDRDDSLLVRFDVLHAGISPYQLLDRKVVISDVELIGADARLWKDSLTSNFQFVIDAFKNENKSKTNDSADKSKKWNIIVDVENVNIKDTHVKWDVRHKLRKNLHKPHRGAFDANHLDAMLSVRARVKQTGKGEFDIAVKDMCFLDKASGLDVKQINLNAIVSKEKVEASKVLLKLKHSEINLSPFSIDLKKNYIDEPFTLSAKILLQDIAQPFAPVLSNFSTLLELNTSVSGPLSSLNLKDIHIKTPDKRLKLTANGCLDGLFAKKEKLNLQFRKIDMKASNKVKEQIVMHFAKKVRLKMMRQLKAVGDIRFRGSVSILYKREVIAGKISTQYGNVSTSFTINDIRHYMTGYLNTSSFEIGKLMNVDKLGPVNCHIDFDFNISKKTPRPATALPHGRLPQGSMQAKIYDAKYGIFHTKEVTASVESDGSTATGSVVVPKRLVDLIVDFDYIQTDDQQHLKVRPRPKFHFDFFKRKKKQKTA